MKFYVIYQQSFPLGFGLSACILLSIGLWGIFTKKPLVISFLLTFLTYLGILIPLFLLSLNHFLVAWPLDIGAALLNGGSVLAIPLLLAWLWFSRFETTTVGAPAEKVKESLLGAGVPASKVITFCKSTICYLRPGAEGPTGRELRRSLSDQLAERVPSADLLSYFLCILGGVICVVTATISWCVSTRCWAA